MFSKALEKVTDLLVTKLSTMSLGWPLLFLFASIGASYLAVGQLRSDPTVVKTLLDARFLSILLVIFTVFGGYLVIHFMPSRRVAQIALFSFLLFGSTTVWWQYIHAEERSVLIDVVFDNTVGLHHTDIANFLSDVQQPHIRITLRSLVLDPKPEVPVLDYNAAHDFARAFLRPAGTATHTALISAKPLSETNWQNLFYVTAPEFSVISTYGVATAGSPEAKVILRKYLASMIPLAALQGQALAKGRTLLKDRDPATEHGCLLDFSVDKDLMLEKLRRGPVMCQQEAVDIAAVFGDTIASEYKNILSKTETKNLH